MSGARRWVVVSAVLLGLAGMPSLARACSMVEAPLELRLEAAEIVVYGVVRRVQPNRAEVAVRTVFRRQTKARLEVENRHIGYMSDCSELLYEDGRFTVGDKLLLFLYTPEDTGIARPVGLLGDGAFMRTGRAFEWVGEPGALFDAGALFSFARSEGDLLSATRSTKARQYVDPPEEPPPIPPQRAAGCTSGVRSARGELLLLVLLAGGLVARRS